MPLFIWASLVAQVVKNLPAMQEIWVWSLGWEDPLEMGKATHSNILAYYYLWPKYCLVKSALLFYYTLAFSWNLFWHVELLHFTWKYFPKFWINIFLFETLAKRGKQVHTCCKGIQLMQSPTVLYVSLMAQQLKNPPAIQETQEMQDQPLGWEDPWRRKWQPTPVFLLKISHRERSYSP